MAYKTRKGVAELIVACFDRITLLHLLPKGGVVAEIGVHMGAFAESIRHIVVPAKLHLIDPWAYGGPNAKRAETTRQALVRVQTVFADDVAAGRVSLHQDRSTVAAASFPDDYFDWIYIDARHDYRNVRADLFAFQNKVKREGFILGHDFANSAQSRSREYGVVRAVREFAAEARMSIILITNEAGPSFLLAREENQAALPRLRQRLHDLANGLLVEVDVSLLDGYEQIEALGSDGRAVQLLTFHDPRRQV